LTNKNGLNVQNDLLKKTSKFEGGRTQLGASTLYKRAQKKNMGARRGSEQKKRSLYSAESGRESREERSYKSLAESQGEEITGNTKEIRGRGDSNELERGGGEP